MDLMMNDSLPPRQPIRATGLCGTCRQVRLIGSDRASVFLRCSRADLDPAFVRYPTLPMLACPGYDPE